MRHPKHPIVRMTLLWIAALLLLSSSGCFLSARVDLSATPSKIFSKDLMDRSVSQKSTNNTPETLPGTELSQEAVDAVGVDAFFTVDEISDEVFNRMYGLSFKADCTVPRDSLRYLRVLCRDYDGAIFVGEMVVNIEIAQDVSDIFKTLYLASYPIERMSLVDEYGADDDASMEADNTSAFNYRLIAGTNNLSNHALGMAIDINPFYNPYVIPDENYCSPVDADEYADRSWDFPYKITKGDLCYTLFLEHGFSWGGDWSEIKDYQHFEKTI